MEEYVEAVMTTVVSFIPNIQRFSSMLGTLSFEHCFPEVNFSSIMEATINMFTILVDSHIPSSPSFISLA